MRVLHVMASGARGGGADHLLGLLPALAEQGVRPSALVGDDGPLAARLGERGVPAETLGLMQSRLDPRLALRLARRVKERAPDIVHYHGTRAAFFGCSGRLLAGRMPPSVYTAHGLSYRKQMPAAERALYLGVEALICRSVDRVLSVSRADLEDLERRGFLHRGSGLHVPNAVAPPFHPGERASARRLAGVPQSAHVVGTVARLVPQKSVGDLVDAMEALPDAVLVVIGDGPERPMLERRARGLGGRAVFLGSRDDVAALLPALDLFALPSRWEGEPIALLEAMACGVPVVATATSGARELIEATGAGLLVPVAAPEALGRALGDLLERPEERARLVQAGLCAVAERSYEKMATRVLAVYSALGA